MGKKIALFFVFIIICGTLSACNNNNNNSSSSSSSIEGTLWLLTSGTIGGADFSKEELKEAYGDYTYSFEKDGVVTITVLEKTFQGTYTQKENIVEINNAGQEYTAQVEGDTMKMDYLDVSYVFTKQES